MIYLKIVGGLILATIIFAVFLKNSVINAKSNMKYIDNETLEYKQMVFEKKHKSYSSSSGLRGVKKRYIKATN